MDLGLSGKKAIVCGSSRGLGRACAQALAEAGAVVFINGRDSAILEDTAAQIAAETGARVIPVVADLSQDAGKDALLQACPAPDILVNNNGGPPFRPFSELDTEAIRRGVEMNMITPITLIQRMIDGMAGRGFGRIVNITSVTVKMPVPGLDLSSGARAGLTGFVTGVARSVAHRNVTINQLLPGYFDTGRLREGFAAGGATRMRPPMNGATRCQPVGSAHPGNSERPAHSYARSRRAI